MGPSRSNTCSTAFAKHEFPIFGIPLIRRRSQFHAPSAHIALAGFPYSISPRSTSGGSGCARCVMALSFGRFAATASADTAPDIFLASRTAPGPGAACRDIGIRKHHFSRPDVRRHALQSAAHAEQPRRVRGRVLSQLSDAPRQRPPPAWICSPSLSTRSALALALLLAAGAAFLLPRVAPAA
eukprot:5773751-Pyramimonas_sp.AAC.1